jgi:hypothetical protein
MPVARPHVQCPNCKKSFIIELPRPACAPFCSDRCKMADLSKWLGGEFAIPATDLDEGDGERLEAELDLASRGGRND